MTTKSMAYDHPAYLVPVVYSGSTVAGANGVSPKFAAFTAQKIKSVTLGPAVAATSSTDPKLFIKSGTATTTTALSALTSAASAAVNNDVSSLALAQGDQFWIAHGTDATVVAAVAIETVVVPGSTITN